jgi:DNA-binding LacI/PurR family transcriptional regulator
MVVTGTTTTTTATTGSFHLVFPPRDHFSLFFSSFFQKISASVTNQRTQTTVIPSSEEKHQQPLKESVTSSLPRNQSDSNVIALEEKLKQVID